MIRVEHERAEHERAARRSAEPALTEADLAPAQPTEVDLAGAAEDGATAYGI